MKKSENYQFELKWVNWIKNVKCNRMKSISPVRLWILSALYYFKPQIHKKVKINNFNESRLIGLST